MLIEEHPFLASLPDAERSLIAETADIVRLEKGEKLFEEQSESDCVILALEGTIAFQKTDDEGNPHDVGIAEAGGFFGEIGALTGSPRAAAAVAKESAVVAKIGNEAIQRHLKALPGPSRLMFESVVRHLNTTTERYISNVVRQEKMSVVGQMTGSIIHDFKNPFAIIGLTSDLISSRHLDDSKTQDYCDSIQAQIQRMVTMAEELIEFARGKQTLRAKPTNMRALFDRFRAINAPYFEREDIDVRIESEDFEIVAEGDKLLRVLQNLLGNAIDAIDGRAAQDTGCVSAIARKGPDEEALIEISDNAGGIPEKIRDRFFEPFVTSGKRKGTGLGAAIAKSIVEAHGGSIEFETESGKGTTFHIRLPAAGPEA